MMKPDEQETKLNNLQEISDVKDEYATNVTIIKPQTLRASILRPGEELKAMNANSIKTPGMTYSLYAKVSSLGSNGFISIGRRETNGYEFGINGEKWVYLRNGKQMGDGIPHGLVIKDYVNIRIFVEEDTGIADITVYTNGGVYHRTNTSWEDYHGNPGVYNGSSDSISDVLFTWTSTAINSKIWIIGDSYISLFSEKRWPFYIKAWGYDKDILFNGYPGEDTHNAYKDLLEIQNYAKPSIVIWAMGMNDPDDAAINSDWLQYTNDFLNWCKTNNVTPILATIPCTPNADNSYKNNWVRTSGLRYIEFANAVNIYQNSSVWYDNMLSMDNVHPDVQGAITLAIEAISDVPEIMIN